MLQLVMKASSQAKVIVPKTLLWITHAGLKEYLKSGEKITFVNWARCPKYGKKSNILV